MNKAKETHYLNNSERVTLLYTFGHLGQEGKDFLHKVISNCINYDYEYTEKKIRKMKSFPISCPKIRKQLTGVEKSIQRIEADMGSYFDKAGTDSITTEYGVLERRKKAGNKCEWVIRLRVCSHLSR